MDVYTKEQRSYNMSQVKSENTKPEKLMFALLKKSGYRFRRHYPVAGKPDIAFPKNKVAVFINGEFWHGKDYKFIKNKLSEFWVNKIGQNIRRDRFVQRELRKEGWHILNFWGRRVVRNPEKSIKRLMKYLEKLNGHGGRVK